MVGARSPDESAPAELAGVGAVIAGKFIVERALGAGGMGQVVCARHRELGTRVAIKLMNANAAIDPDSRARFKREALAIARLTNDHTVRVYDVGETPSGIPFMIMEYLEGRDLGSLLREKHPLEIDNVLLWMVQVAEALIEAHDAGIIHRDLKPHNIFLTRRSSGESHIRVLDFGLAKPIARLEGASPDSRRFNDGHVTMPGNVVGTSHYMAPEQLRGAELDARCDVWGLGACLFRLITQAYPFSLSSSAGAAAIAVAILSDPPQDVRKLRPDVPAEVIAIIHRCLQKQPSDRYATMRDLAAALRAARVQEEATTRFTKEMVDDLIAAAASGPVEAEPTEHERITARPPPPAPAAGEPMTTMASPVRTSDPKQPAAAGHNATQRLPQIAAPLLSGGDRTMASQDPAQEKQRAATIGGEIRGSALVAQSKAQQQAHQQPSQPQVPAAANQNVTQPLPKLPAHLSSGGHAPAAAPAEPQQAMPQPHQPPSSSHGAARRRPPPPRSNATRIAALILGLTWAAVLVVGVALFVKFRGRAAANLNADPAAAPLSATASPGAPPTPIATPAVSATVIAPTAVPADPTPPPAASTAAAAAPVTTPTAAPTPVPTPVPTPAPRPTRPQSSRPGPAPTGGIYDQL